MEKILKKILKTKISLSSSEKDSMSLGEIIDIQKENFVKGIKNIPILSTLSNIIFDSDEESKEESEPKKTGKL